MIFDDFGEMILDQSRACDFLDSIATIIIDLELLKPRINKHLLNDMILARANTLSELCKASSVAQINNSNISHGEGVPYFSFRVNGPGPSSNN